MHVKEAHPSRDPVKEGRGSSVGVTLGAETLPNFLICVIDDIGVEWFRQYYAQWGARWEEANGAAIGIEDDAIAEFSFFEEMADAGLLFYDCTASPICGPTRVGIKTGRYSFRHGQDINLRDPSAVVGGLSPAGYATPASELFLAEYIKAQKPAYRTAQFNKHHIADQFSTAVTSDAFGCPTTPPDANLTHSTTCGYDHYDIHPANIGGNYTYWRITNGVITQVQGDATSTFTEATYPTAVFGAAAEAWTQAQGNNPWLCWFAAGPPHSLFRVPPFSMIPAATQTKLTAQGLSAGNTATGTVQSSTAMYYNWLATMQATDEQLRRIWEGLTPAVQARTYILIVGDNGTTAEAVQSGFNHAKRQIYWQGTRVPFVVKGPGIKRPGERVRSIVAVQDIFDTVTDLIGIPRATNTRDSVSLIPLLQGRIDRTAVNSHRDYVYTALGTNNLMNGQNEQWALYDGRFRTGLMAGLSSTILTDEAEDPFEEEDASASNAVRKAEMIAAKVALVGS